MNTINVPSFNEVPAFTDDLVDQLGTIKQAIDELEATARKFKTELIKRGVGTYEGICVSLPRCNTMIVPRSVQCLYVS